MPSNDFYQKVAFPKPPKSDGRKKQLRDDAKARSEYLLAHPFCADPNCHKRSTEVDHIIPKKMGGTRRPELHDDRNFQALCPLHHKAKHGERVKTIFGEPVADY